MRRPITSPWSDQQIATLKALLKAGATPLRAAAALGRSLVSVKAKARLLGSPFPSARRRRKAPLTDMSASVETLQGGPQALDKSPHNSEQEKVAK
jgi:hypothetical protein